MKKRTTTILLLFYLYFTAKQFYFKVLKFKEKKKKINEYNLEYNREF